MANLGGVVPNACLGPLHETSAHRNPIEAFANEKRTEWARRENLKMGRVKLGNTSA